MIASPRPASGALFLPRRVRQLTRGLRIAFSASSTSWATLSRFSNRMLDDAAVGGGSEGGQSSSCRMAPTSPSATPSMEARPLSRCRGVHLRRPCDKHDADQDYQSRPRPQAGRHGGRPPAARSVKRRLLATPPLTTYDAHSSKIASALVGSSLIRYTVCRDTPVAFEIALGRTS